MVTQRFLDSREFLLWDPVFGTFNRREDKIVNGRFSRRYWHILPVNFVSGTKTFTDTPYTGAQILDFFQIGGIELGRDERRIDGL